MQHADAKAQQDDIVVVKKYANRRLYNTETSTYVTLEDLRKMVSAGRDFLVCDAKTGTDITRSILTQIIFEMESKSDGFLLPETFMKSLIGYYDDTIKDFVPPYLENSMETFMQNQEKMRDTMATAMKSSADAMKKGSKMMTPMSGMGSFEDITKQNMEMFSSAMKMFSPFGAMSGQENPATKKKKK